MKVNNSSSKYSMITMVVFLVLSSSTFTQVDPGFFPDFVPYQANPIIRYGDGFADAAWNDPCILKEGDQYIMYITAADGFVLSEENTVKVFRQVSMDGYEWTLSPITPVLEAASGTYYAGGTETPSVVKKDGIYHMYLTCYPPGNSPSEFVIAHATSLDGLSFSMDDQPVLESDGSATMYGELVGEPAAVVFNDSIFVFFTAGGIVSEVPVNSIGLMKSSDGVNFNDAQIAVTLPEDVYPSSEEYWGLSTPSALAIHDSLYLFTDVAQMIDGNWTQVALHQFKTFGSTGIWYHDDAPIHTRADFDWTNGDYLAEIRSITPYLEEDGLLRIWYAGNNLASISGTDTTYNIFFDQQGGMHVDPDYWGIGTSEYQFPMVSGVKETGDDQLHLSIYPNPANDMLVVYTGTGINGYDYKIYDMTGRSYPVRYEAMGDKVRIDLSMLSGGIYSLSMKKGTEVLNSKFVVK